MIKARWFSAWLLLGLCACASMTEQQRINRFNETSRAYRWALLDSDFRAAANFIDPQAHRASKDPGIYKEVKIVDVKFHHLNTAADGQRIEQEVELDYYLLKRNILKNMRSRQVWQYNSTDQTWVLMTPLPVFDR